MIAEVDEGLRTLVKREALNGTDVELVFDAPTRDWAARRNTPTLDFYLYDIREDLKIRAYGSVNVLDGNGHTSGRQGPPKYFKLSYLVTAWTQRPEDEHRLLSAVLLCLLRHASLPDDVMSGVLAEQGVPVRVSVALPPPDERSISDVWSALGGELKASIDVRCLVAIDVHGIRQVGPPVLESPRFRFDGAGGAGESETMAARRRRSGGGQDGTDGDSDRVEEEVRAGEEGQPGRTFMFRTMAGEIDR